MSVLFLMLSLSASTMLSLALGRQCINIGEWMNIKTTKSISGGMPYQLNADFWPMRLLTGRRIAHFTTLTAQKKSDLLSLLILHATTFTPFPDISKK